MKINYWALVAYVVGSIALLLSAFVLDYCFWIALAICVLSTVTLVIGSTLMYDKEDK